MRKKGKKTQDLTLTQEVVRTGVQGQAFDIVLRFDNKVDQPQLFMDELVKLVLEGLIDQYGSIIVKFNWWSKDLTVIAPNSIPVSTDNWSIDRTILDASETLPESSGATKDQKTTSTMDG